MHTYEYNINKKEVFKLLYWYITIFGDEIDLVSQLVSVRKREGSLI